jgi:hypothetical protein
MKDIRYVRNLHCALLILFSSVHFSCDLLFVAAIKIHFFTSLHVNLFQLQIRGDAMTANDKNLFPHPFVETKNARIVLWRLKYLSISSEQVKACFPFEKLHMLRKAISKAPSEALSDTR